MNEGIGQGSNQKGRGDRGTSPTRSGAWPALTRRRAGRSRIAGGGTDGTEGAIETEGAIGGESAERGAAPAWRAEARRGSRSGLAAEVALGERLRGTRPEAADRLSWRAQFGEAVLECVDGRVVLRGGSMADRLEALEWLALFLPETVARLER